MAKVNLTTEERERLESTLADAQELEKQLADASEGGIGDPDLLTATRRQIARIQTLLRVFGG